MSPSDEASDLNDITFPIQMNFVFSNGKAKGKATIERLNNNKDGNQTIFVDSCKVHKGGSQNRLLLTLTTPQFKSVEVKIEDILSDALNRLPTSPKKK